MNLFTNAQSYIVLDILYPTLIVLLLKIIFQFHEYNITIPNVSKFGFHGGEDNALSCGGILAFWIMDVSHIIHSISERASKICNRTSSFSTLLRIVLTIRYHSFKIIHLIKINWEGGNRSHYSTTIM